MSQIHFHDGDYSVLTGWDRPLQYFFLVIEPLIDEDEDSPVYCNLDDPTLDRGGMTIEQITAKLASFGITVPAELPALLAQHQTEAGSPVVWIET